MGAGISLHHSIYAIYIVFKIYLQKSYMKVGQNTFMSERGELQVTFRMDNSNNNRIYLLRVTGNWFNKLKIVWSQSAGRIYMFLSSVRLKIDVHNNRERINQIPKLIYN